MKNTLKILVLGGLALMARIGTADEQNPDIEHTSDLSPKEPKDKKRFVLEPQQTGKYNVNIKNKETVGSVKYVLDKKETKVSVPTTGPLDPDLIWVWKYTGGDAVHSFVFEVANTIWEDKEDTVTVKCEWKPESGTGGKTGAGKTPKKIPGRADGLAIHKKGTLKVTDLAILDPPDYLCINETLELSAWVMRPDDFPWDFLDSVEAEWEVTPTENGTIDLPFAHSVIFTPLETGDVTITATAPGTEGPITDSVTITIIKVEIKLPHGDPSISATAWNDPDSDAANVGNERTFSGGNSPGIATVTVPCVASIEPASVENEFSDRLRWSIDNVGPIQAVWNPHVDCDPHKGKGLSPTATFTTTADGLPANNDAFGTKVVRLQVDGMDCGERTTNVEIFYPRDSKNHSGGQAGSPNWFHYWMQARPNPDVVFEPTLGAFGRVPGMTGWRYDVEPNKDRIEIGTAHPDKSKQYGVGKEYSGIDRMISTVIHEEKHVQQIAAADALMPPTNGNDSFRYGWSWNQATHNHWNEGPDGKWGVAGVDDDGSGTVDDATPLPPFEPGWPGSDDIMLNLDYTPSGYNNWPEAWPLPEAYPGTYNAPGGSGVWLSPIETEAVRHANNLLDEHDYWEQDWGNPGKQHKTNKHWND